MYAIRSYYEQQEDGKIKLTLIDMELGEPDKSGRRRPQPVEGSESTMLVDTVIAAIGQGTVAPEGVSTNKWGALPYDKETNLVEDNVFTAGDCATGPATVIEAVGHAKRTATSIATFVITSYSIHYTKLYDTEFMTYVVPCPGTIIQVNFNGNK